MIKINREEHEVYLCLFGKRYVWKNGVYMGTYNAGKKAKKIKCHICGKKFEVGNRPDGLPNGCGYELADGSIINVCTDCIMRYEHK